MLIDLPSWLSTVCVPWAKSRFNVKQKNRLYWFSTAWFTYVILPNTSVARCVGHSLTHLSDLLMQVMQGVDQDEAVKSGSKEFFPDTKKEAMSDGDGLTIKLTIFRNNLILLQIEFTYAGQVTLPNQCDQMAWLYVLYLVIYNNKHLLKSIKNCQKRFKMLPNTILALNKWQKIYKIPPKWRNFANCSHTASTYLNFILKWFSLSSSVLLRKRNKLSCNTAAAAVLRLFPQRHFPNRPYSLVLSLPTYTFLPHLVLLLLGHCSIWGAIALGQYSFFKLANPGLFLFIFVLFSLQFEYKLKKA